MAVFWALANMFFAAFNDMVFKGYARKPRSHGFFIAIVGVIFGITAACLVTEPVNWRATLRGVFTALQERDFSSIRFTPA